MSASPPDLPPEVAKQLTVFAPLDCALVLQYFHQRSTEVATVDELRDFICDQTDTDEQQVSIRLQHATLPKLDDVGLIDYDGRSKAVRHVGRPVEEVSA